MAFWAACGLNGFFDRLARDIERWGLVRTLCGRIAGLNRTWLVICGIYSRPIDRSFESLPVDSSGITFRLATRKDLLSAAAHMSDHLSFEFVESALDRGDVCAAAFDGARMVSYIWRAFTATPHTEGLWVRFQKPYRYGYKAYTDPAYRGRHLQNPIRLLADDTSVALGCTASISFIEINNYQSIAAELRRGNSRVGFAGYVRLFGKVFPFRSRGARQHTFEFFQPSRATETTSRA